MLTVFIAGILSILSPCVLPVIPVLATQSLFSTRKSLFLMSLGFVLSFTIVGFAVTLLAPKLLFDPEIIRQVGAVFMLLMALGMLVPFFATPFEKIGLHFENFSKKMAPASLQKTAFFQGATLGLIWSPCTGPALGVALGWIAVSNTLAKGSVYLTVFGIGAGLCLLILGLLAQKLGHHFFLKNRERLRFVYRLGAVVVLLVAIAVLTHVDKNIEGLLTDKMPDWWTNVLIQF